MASMDPYCVYDTSQGACVGINSANQNTSIQNVTGGVADCPRIGEKIVATSSNVSMIRLGRFEGKL